MLNRILATTDDRAIVLIRLMVGSVFLSEGIQKFLYPAFVGAGRFVRMGMPAPEFTAAFVGTFEILCGALLLAGLLTRAAAVPLIIIMLTALVTTKLPILLGQDLGPFALRNLKYYGFWSMAHEARTDWSMLLGSIFLLIKGAGGWSLDRVLLRKSGKGFTSSR